MLSLWRNCVIIVIIFCRLVGKTISPDGFQILYPFNEEMFLV